VNRPDLRIVDDLVAGSGSSARNRTGSFVPARFLVGSSSSVKARKLLVTLGIGGA
jgi:hypothetical protein